MTPTTRPQALQAGEEFYFTGEPCVHGHIADRYTSTQGCVECYREITRKRQQKNREEYLSMPDYGGENCPCNHCEQAPRCRAEPVACRDYRYFMDTGKQRVKDRVPTRIIYDSIFHNKEAK